ncbi:polyadenylate-binding protein RBP47B, partial [Trifolium medium]|nr:polyadenylate-binding protein RBP47B [Trifolium medium]
GGGGGYYGYPQGGYENYGYAAAPAGQDPNVYGSYPGYAGYQHPQQQQQQMGYS